MQYVSRRLNVTVSYSVEQTRFFCPHSIVNQFGDYEDAIWLLSEAATLLVDGNESVPAQQSAGSLHPIVANAPFAAIGATEQPRGGEEKPTPAPHPQRRLVAIDDPKDGFDLITVRLEIGKPIERGAHSGGRLIFPPFAPEYERRCLQPATTRCRRPRDRSTMSRSYRLPGIAAALLHAPGARHQNPQRAGEEGSDPETFMRNPRYPR